MEITEIMVIIITTDIITDGTKTENGIIIITMVTDMVHVHHHGIHMIIQMNHQQHMIHYKNVQICFYNQLDVNHGQVIIMIFVI